MVWVKQILRGAEFTMEVINMMCFMMEEAAQSGIMAHGMAMQNLNIDLAEEIYEETLLPCSEFLFQYWALYALPMMPNSSAWQCFHLAFLTASRHAHWNVQDYKRLLALGIDPRPGKSKNKP